MKIKVFFGEEGKLKINPLETDIPSLIKIIKKEHNLDRKVVSNFEFIANDKGFYLIFYIAEIENVKFAEILKYQEMINKKKERIHFGDIIYLNKGRENK